VAIVNTPEEIEPAPRPRTIIDVARRALAEITINEIFVTDLRRFVRLNHLVRQAEAAGLTLNDIDGEPLRFVPISIVIPEEPLGDTLDFRPEVIAESLRRGEVAARAVLAGQDPRAVVEHMAESRQKPR
jgi:NTE family protein